MSLHYIKTLRGWDLYSEYPIDFPTARHVSFLIASKWKNTYGEVRQAWVGMNMELLSDLAHDVFGGERAPAWELQIEPVCVPDEDEADGSFDIYMKVTNTMVSPPTQGA